MGVSTNGVRLSPGSSTTNRIAATLLAAAMLSLGACSDDDVTSSGNVTSISIAPTAASIEVGASAQFSATVIMTGRGSPNVTWQSSAPEVATVSAQGEVIGVSEGVAVLTAKAVANPQKLAVAIVTVLPGDVESVVVEPDPAHVIRGSTLQLSVAAFNSSGARIPARIAAWSTANPLIATVSTAGVVSGIAFGATGITATIDGVRGAASIVVGVGTVDRVIIQPANLVLDEGEEAALTARPIDAVGNVVVDADVFWMSSDPLVATVSEFGVVTAISLGSAVITARAQTGEGTMTVAVVAPMVVNMSITPRPATLEERTFVQLSATVLDNSGAPMSVPITWTSSAPLIASVTANGLLSGVAASATPVFIVARASISATRTLADSFAVTIVPASVASIVTTVPKTTIEVGETTIAKAVMYDAGGNILTDRYCHWSVDKPGIVSVAADGTVTGLAIGDAIVTAESGNAKGTTIVHVVRAEVASIVLKPASFGLYVGQTMSLTVEVRDKRGGLITGRAIAWTSSSAAIAAVVNGIVTGNSAGTATISATVDAKTGQSSAVVQWSTAAVHDVIVKLAKNALDVAQQTTATATLLDVQGYILNGRAIQWSSSNPAVATVSKTGVVSAVGDGTAAIRATSEGITGEAQLAVTSRPWMVGDHMAQVDLARGATEISVIGVGQIVAQSFAPNDDHWFGYVSLPVFCPAGGSMTVKIREGVDGPVLYQGSASGLPTVRDGRFSQFQLFDPSVSSTGIWITKGTTYVVELSSPTALTAGQCGIMRGPAVDTYPRGSAFRQEGTLPWQAIATGEDFPFKTYVRK